MKKMLAVLVTGFLLYSPSFAADGQRAETTGVDIHYQDGEYSDKSWFGSVSYARLVVNNLEVGGAYTFSGSSPGGTKTQGIQLIGRQWFGPYPKSNAVIPFVELAGGLEFANGEYENALAVGGGVGMFVSERSELRMTVKHTSSGFEDVTTMNVGYFYHF